MSTTTRLITADELLVMPHRDKHGNDCRLELIRGELRVMSPSKSLHGIVCAHIAGELRDFVRAHDLGVVVGAETGFIVERDPDTVLGVDAAFISHERLSTIEDLDKFAPLAPDLAVEVMSPSDTAREMETKVALYFAAGARAVWVLNPKKKTVAVYASPTDMRILEGQDTLEGGEVLPGFGVALSELFAIGKR